MLADALAVAIAGVDSVLVPTLAVAPLLETARGLSGGVAAYIECRPASESEQTDLLVCFLSTNDPRRQKRNAEDADHADRGWSLAAAVQRARRTPGTALRDQSPLVWLEFDDAGRRGSNVTPSVCVCVEPSYLEKDRCREPNPACEESIQAVAVLAGLPPADATAVERCVRSLPQGGRAIHLSVMCARASGATKLYARVPLDGAHSYLHEIGWAGDGEAVADLLQWRRATDPFVHLDISIAQGRVSDRLGVAFPRGNDGRRFHLDVYHGLAKRCLAPNLVQKVMEAGSEWVRTQPALSRPNRWAHVVHRWIDQKIVFDRGQRELKFYLAVRPLPFLFGSFASAGGSQ